MLPNTLWPVISKNTNSHYLIYNCRLTVSFLRVEVRNLWSSFNYDEFFYNYVHMLLHENEKFCSFPENHKIFSHAISEILSVSICIDSPKWIYHFTQTLFQNVCSNIMIFFTKKFYVSVEKYLLQQTDRRRLVFQFRQNRLRMFKKHEKAWEPLITTKIVFDLNLKL